MARVKTFSKKVFDKHVKRVYTIVGSGGSRDRIFDSGKSDCNYHMATKKTERSQSSKPVLLRLTKNVAYEALNLINEVGWMSGGKILPLAVSSEDLWGADLTFIGMEAVYRVRIAAATCEDVETGGSQPWGCMHLYKEPWGAEEPVSLCDGNTWNGRKDWVRIRDAILQAEDVSDD